MNLVDLADIHAAALGIEIPFPGAMLLGDSVPPMERTPSRVKRQTNDSATKPLTPRQQEVFHLIVTATSRYGFPPTLRELHRALGMTGKSVSGVAMHVAALVRKGYVTKHDHQMRTIKVLKQPGAA